MLRFRGHQKECPNSTMELVKFCLITGENTSKEGQRNDNRRYNQIIHHIAKNRKNSKTPIP